MNDGGYGYKKPTLTVSRKPTTIQCSSLKHLGPFPMFHLTVFAGNSAFQCSCDQSSQLLSRPVNVVERPEGIVLFMSKYPPTYQGSSVTHKPNSENLIYNVRTSLIPIWYSETHSRPNQAHSCLYYHTYQKLYLNLMCIINDNWLYLHPFNYFISLYVFISSCNGIHVGLLPHYDVLGLYSRQSGSWCYSSFLLPWLWQSADLDFILRKKDLISASGQLVRLIHGITCKHRLLHNNIGFPPTQHAINQAGCSLKQNKRRAEWF